MLGEFVRKSGFWTLDFLKGGKIRAHYRDIKEIMEAGTNTQNKRDMYLSRLLDHAVSTTEYYSKYNHYRSIKDFPIIDKNSIKANEARIMSKKHRGEKLHPMSTSGSTGTPFTVLQDRNKRRRVQAEVVYFGEICGYDLGDKIASLRVWTDKNRKSRLGNGMQNLVPVDISKLDNENLESIIKVLKGKEKIKCILSYAKSLDILSRYLMEKGDSPDMFSVEVVISGAQELIEPTRENLKKYLGAPLYLGILTKKMVY